MSVIITLCFYSGRGAFIRGGGVFNLDFTVTVLESIRFGLSSQRYQSAHQVIVLFDFALHVDHAGNKS